MNAAKKKRDRPRTPPGTADDSVGGSFSPAPEEPTPSTPFDRRAALAIGLVAVVVRLVHFAIYSRSPMFRHPILDLRYYDEWGRRIANGEWVGSQVFEMSPLYSYFLGVVYTVFGYEKAIACLIQAGLGVATCVLLHGIARRFFGSRAALATGLLAAVYPVFVYYDVMIMKTSLGLFLGTASLWFVTRQRSTFDPWLAGVTLGAAALVRDNFLAVAPLWMAWMAAPKRFGGRARPLAAGALALGVATAVFPVTLRNYAVSGDFVLTTSGGGEVFYIGNNPEATGLYEAPPFVRPDPRFEHEDFRVKARELTGEDLSYAEASRYWFRRGLDYVRSNPGRTALLYLRKFAYLWNRVEVADNYSFRFNRTLSAPLRVPLDYGMLAALALVALALERRRLLRLAPLVLFFVGYFAGLLPFFYFSRFRVPLTAVLLVLAGVAVARAVARLRARDWKGLALIGGPAAGIYALTALPIVPFADYRDFSNPLEKLGVAWLDDGKPDRALEAFERSAAISPDRDTIQFNLGLAHERLGRLADASRAYERALRLDPGNGAARARLEILRSGASTDLSAAVEDLRDRLRSEGLHEAEIEREVGRFFDSKGAWDRAVEAYRRARAAGADDTETALFLAIDLSRTGRPAEGLELTEVLLTREPTSVPVLWAHTGCLMDLKRHEEARGLLEDALESNPDSVRLYLRLGQIERTLGRREEAVRWFRGALERARSQDERELAMRNLRALER